MCQLVVGRRLVIARRPILGLSLRGRRRWAPAYGRDQLREIEAGLLDTGEPARIAQECAIAHALAESIAKVVGAGEALAGVLRQAPQDHGVGVLVQTRVGRALAGGDDPARHMAVQDLQHRLPYERNHAGEHLVEHGAQGVDIAACVDRLLLCLLGRQVVGRTADGARSGGRAGAQVEKLGHAEVEQLDGIVIPLGRDLEADAGPVGRTANHAAASLAADEKNVRRFEIAVHDAKFVGCAQAARHLSDDVDCLEDRQPTDPAQTLLQVFAVEVLHHQEYQPIGRGAEVGHVDDVGVADATGGLGLDEELLHNFRLPGKPVVQHLDGHRLLENDMLGAVDDAHATLADHALDLMVLEQHADAGDDLGREQGRPVHGTQVQRSGETAAATGAGAGGAHR